MPLKREIIMTAGLWAIVCVLLCLRVALHDEITAAADRGPEATASIVRLR